MPKYLQNPDFSGINSCCMFKDLDQPDSKFACLDLDSPDSTWRLCLQCIQCIQRTTCISTPNRFSVFNVFEAQFQCLQCVVYILCSANMSHSLLRTTERESQSLSIETSSANKTIMLSCCSPVTKLVLLFGAVVLRQVFRWLHDLKRLCLRHM